MLQSFVCGRDRTPAFVDQIAGLLIHAPEFHDTELYDELIDAVTCYRPGGGEGLYDEEAVASAFRDALHELASQAGG
jgi:hypothetical protein